MSKLKVVCHASSSSIWEKKRQCAQVCAVRRRALCLLPLLRDPDLRHTHTQSKHTGLMRLQKHKRSVSIRNTQQIFNPKKYGDDFFFYISTHTCTLFNVGSRRAAQSFYFRHGRILFFCQVGKNDAAVQTHTILITQLDCN